MRLAKCCPHIRSQGPKMVLLEFQVDEAAFREAEEANPAAIGAAVVEQTYLVMPVRLRVGGTELLELPPSPAQGLWISEPGGITLPPRPDGAVQSPWRSLPLLHVAVEGLAQVRQARARGSATYHLPGGGWLRFEVAGENVLVTSDLGQTAVATIAALVQAFEEFAAAVRAALRQRLPELSRHPYWGRWLQEAG